MIDRCSTPTQKCLHNTGLICDVGCGPSGQIGKYLLHKNHQVVGIDISSKCIEIAKKQAPEIEFRVMDMMHTDFGKGKFDGIVAFYSIIFTPKKEVDKIVGEFNRILKKDGKLLIVVKKGKEEGIIKNDWYEGNKVYFSHFVEEEMLGYLKRNGFVVDYLDTRSPYENEVDVERIYIVGTKVENCT